MPFVNARSRGGRRGDAPSEDLRQSIDGKRGDSFSFARIFQPLAHHWLMIALLSAASILIGALLGLRQPRVYRATARLDVVASNSDAHSDSPNSDVQTQIKLLHSPEVLRRVAAKLDLEHRPAYQASSSLLMFHSKPANSEERIRDLSQRVTMRVTGQPPVVEITGESHDPSLAAGLANAFAQEYIEIGGATLAKSANESTQALSSQLPALKANLDRSENALHTYAGEAKRPGSPESYSNAREERDAAEARYVRALHSPPEALPEVLGDFTLRTDFEKLTALKRQESELRAAPKPTPSSVKQVEEQIAALESEIQKRKDASIQRMKDQYEAARGREQMAFQTTDTDPGAQPNSMRFAALKQEVETNTKLYESMAQKVKEAEVSAASQSPNARLVSAAAVPESPAKRIPALYAICGGAFGALLGVVIAFLRTGNQAHLLKPLSANLWQGIRQLAAIPHTPCLIQNDAAPGTEGWDHLAAVCRSTVTSVILDAPRGDRPRVIAVTSTQAREGKTTVAANFAIALAESNQRVLLIDGNLLTPRLHKIFGVSNTGGLSGLLENVGAHVQRSFADFCAATTVPGLFLMPAGASGRAFASRLFSPNLPSLMDNLRREFDTIVIDAAALSRLDYRPLARVADGVVVVVGTRIVPHSAAKAAVARLLENGAVVIGAVMNNFDPSKVVVERKASVNPLREQSCEAI